MTFYNKVGLFFLACGPSQLHLLICCVFRQIQSVLYHLLMVCVPGRLTWLGGLRTP